MKEYNVEEKSRIGVGTLPSPLSQEEEEEIVNKLKKGDEKTRQILIERNLRLVVDTVKKFENTEARLEDLISIGIMGLMKAGNTFNKNKKVKFSIYASKCIENEILKYLKMNYKHI